MRLWVHRLGQLVTELPGVLNLMGISIWVVVYLVGFVGLIRGFGGLIFDARFGQKSVCGLLDFQLRI